MYSSPKTFLWTFLFQTKELIKKISYLSLLVFCLSDNHRPQESQQQISVQHDLLQLDPIPILSTASL